MGRLVTYWPDEESGGWVFSFCLAHSFVGLEVEEYRMQLKLWRKHLEEF